MIHQTTFSLLINHAPWAYERTRMLVDMIVTLCEPAASMPVCLHDLDYRGGGPSPKDRPVEFTLNQWRWCAAQDVTHHVLMTDDLDIMWHFWHALHAMVDARPTSIIGLLSNHPKGPELYSRGIHGYRTNSWVVGPAYVVPHEHMLRLLAWEEARHAADQVRGLGWSDDSELNEWITYEGPHEAWHPLPTIIRHKHVASTWKHTGHGDAFSKERLSWEQAAGLGDYDRMLNTKFWQTEAPLLNVGG